MKRELNQLLHMAATIDDRLKEFRTMDDEASRQDARAARTIGVGGAATVAGAGALYGGKKLRNAAINAAGATDDYGNKVARKGMYRDAAKMGVADVKKKAVNKARGVADKAMIKTNRGLRKATKWIAGKRAKMWGLEDGRELVEFKRPYGEYLDAQRVADKKLGKESYRGGGNLIGAGVGAAVAGSAGAALLRKKAKHISGLTGLPINPAGLRRTMVKQGMRSSLIGVAPGIAVGGGIGVNMRKKSKKKELAARLLAFASDEETGYGKYAAAGVGAAGYYGRKQLVKNSRVQNAAGQGVAYKGMYRDAAQDAMRKMKPALDKAKPALDKVKGGIMKGIARGRKMVGLEADLTGRVLELCAAVDRRIG